MRTPARACPRCGWEPTAARHVAWRRGPRAHRAPTLGVDPTGPGYRVARLRFGCARRGVPAGHSARDTCHACVREALVWVLMTSTSFIQYIL
jgi:hypothetical protein